MAFPLVFLARQLVAHLIVAHERERIRREADRITRQIVGSIRVRTDFKSTYAWLSDLQRRKIPKVIAIALTKTAKELQRMLEVETERVFDRPERFTKKAFGITPATADRQSAAIFIKTRQARYLMPQVLGGGRRPKAFERRFTEDTKAPGSYWVAGAGTKLNASGNLSLAKVKHIAAQLQRERRNVFVGRPRPGLPYGIWERPGGRRGPASLKPILVQVSAPQYSKRLDFHGIVQRHAQPIFNREFARAWAQIIG